MKNFTLFRYAILSLAFLLPSVLFAQTCVTTITTYPYTESFEGSGSGGFGAWVQDTGDTTDWSTMINQTPSGATGPLNASNLDYYIYTEATGNSNNTAYLNSPCFDLTGIANPKFSFDYHMYGADMGNLKIQVSTNNGTSWSDFGWNQNTQLQTAGADAWATATLDLSVYIGQTIKLRFHGTIGGGYRSDMSVDNVNLFDDTVVIGACTSTISAFPYNEGFEGSGSGGIGAWVQNTGDDGDWATRSGGTPSSVTGPSNATEGSYYLYTEATNGGTSPGSPKKIAIIESPCFDLTGLLSPKFNFSYHMYGANMGTLKTQISTDNGNTWVGIGTPLSGSSHATHTTPWFAAPTVDLTAYVGQTIMLRFHGFTGIDYRSDMAIDDISIVDDIPAPEINILGNAITIVNGDNTPSTADHTDFVTIDLGSSASRVYTIENQGALALNLTGISPYVTITGVNAADFSITAIPANSIAAGANTTFEVTLTPSAVGTKTATINILSDDSDENPYTFDIEGQVERNFFDSDGDGVSDNLDIDDDNDGILDIDEEVQCKNSPLSITANYKFLNEAFGSGTNRVEINTTYDATTSYCYEDGSSGTNTAACPDLSNTSLNDGEYTVYHLSSNGNGANNTPIGDTASWAENLWYKGEDHTPSDTNGRMALFNASYTPGVFYTANIKGAIPNVPITYSFWVLNLFRETPHNNGSGGSPAVFPNILVEFRDASNNLLTSISTGDIPACGDTVSASDWHQFTANLTFSVSEFNVVFKNNNVGGYGNDLALDDIEIKQTLCDFEGDGVADVFDLDSDNDGIPDVVEAGLGAISDGNATLTSSSSWIDLNGNGMHDLAEGNIPPDTDGDGIPNWLDLDSDNDGIFDVDESGAGNTTDPNYQNGDGDIDGDGVGDGPDSDSVRETDVDSDGIIEYYTDGILDVYDYFNGTNIVTAFGNNNQGTGNVYYVLDTDSDGIPDYMDTTSDGSTYDISHTLYADLDANNDGVIDDLTDTDGDGIVDLFDTDNTTFGSPRILDKKLLLYFDGRNDYVEDTNIIDGIPEATIMGWIKLDASGTGDQIIFGQNEFFIQLNSDKTIEVTADEITLTYGTPLNVSQWIHVGATYSSTNSLLKLYINGDEVANIAISGSLPSDISNFTFGKQPNVDSNYFKGFIDEVRVFSKALNLDEYQKIVYQEIENNTLVRGTVIPRDVATLSWTDLLKYYRLDSFRGDITDDLTTPAIDTGTGAKLYNIKVVEYQNAPMPFITQASGSLDAAVNIPADGVNGLDAITHDSSIVLVEHEDVYYNGNQKHVGLFVNELDASSNPVEFSVQNDSELNVSWYLNLDGKIDLEGESQLVQGLYSELVASSKGTLERDQQGTEDLYTYNYWASPVGVSNTTTNNNGYTIPDVLLDGSTASTPQAINFITNSYDGTPASGISPIGIADYWIWKYANLAPNYYNWQHIRSTGSMLAGEGFTLKGVNDTSGNVSLEQNYVFDGKPNNGDISLTIDNASDYLVGNPYASAIDADQFIADNTDTTGVIYFWEHVGGGTHNTVGYQGGYATYTLSGGVPAMQHDYTTGGTTTGLVPTKTPGQYIPVAQGFFVTGANSGTIKFNNGQRIFQKEDATSVFVKNNNQPNETTSADNRLKIRLGFKSVNNTYSRQILVTEDTNATPQIDFGYDGETTETSVTDMYWTMDSKKYVVQGTNLIDASTILPLGVHTNESGINTIKIDALENVPSDLEIYVYDTVTSLYFDIRNNPEFSINLPAGAYLDRFELRFSNGSSLSTEDFEADSSIQYYFANNNETIVISNPEFIAIKTVEIFNVLGQSIVKFDDIETNNTIELKTNNIATGIYIIEIKTDEGKLSKKVLVE